jgi:endonuclease YncB( thermonuclease family)
VSFLAPRSFAGSPQGRLWPAALAIFAAGAVLGAVVAPLSSAPPRDAPTHLPVPIATSQAYPADVLRVIDGDTFDARVRVWPGMEAVTRVRLRGVDAPEMKARCYDERVKALAARDALSGLLQAGGVGIRNVKRDKYGGRVDADVASADAADVGEALVARGLARHYDGGRRRGWCG